jgi:hypothetical protein
MYLRLHTGVPAGYSQDRPATAVLVRSAAHQPESAKEKRSSCGSLLRPVCVSSRAKLRGVPQAARQQRRKRALQDTARLAVAVGARPRFVQLASDDSYSLCQQITIRHGDLLPLLAPDPWTMPNLLTEDSWLTHPGLVLNRFASASVLAFGILFRLTTPAYHQPLTGQRRATIHAILLAS